MRQPRVWLRNFSRAPLALQAFTIFSAIVALGDVALRLFGPLAMRERIVAFSGWTIGFFYAFVLILAVRVIYSPDLRPRRGIFVLIGIQVISEVVSLAIVTDRSMPHLIRLVWSIVVPLVWGIALSMPTVSDFCDQRNAAEFSNDSR